MAYQTFKDDAGVEWELVPDETPQSTAPKAAATIDIGDGWELVPDEAPSAAVASAPAAPRDNWTRFKDSFGDTLNEGFVGIASRKINDWLDTGIDELKIRNPNATPEQLEQLHDAAIVQTARKLREQAAARQEADPNWRPDESFFDAATAGRWVPWFAGQVAGALGDPTSYVAPGATAIPRILSQAGIAGASDAAYQGIENLEGVKDEYDPYQTAMNSLIGAGFQSAQELAGAAKNTVMKALGKETPTPAAEANPFTSPARPEAPRFTPEQESEYVTLLKTGSTDDIVKYVEGLGFKVSRAETDRWVKNRAGNEDRARLLYMGEGRRTSEEAAANVPRTTPKAFKPQDVQRVVDEATADWAVKPTFKVVPNVNKIADLDPADADSVMGFVDDDGTITMVANRFVDEDTVRAVLFHEALGHYGLTKKFEGDLDDMLETLYTRGSKNFQDSVDQWMIENPDAYPDKKLARAVDEKLAEISERGEITPGLLDPVKNRIKDFLRDRGVNLKYSDREILSILGLAHRGVTGGKIGSFTGTGGKRFMRLWHGSPNKFENTDQENPYGKFDLGRPAAARRYGAGIYTSTDKGYAEGYKGGLSFDSRGNSLGEGHLYEVEVPDNATWLDWDNPVGEDPKNLKILQPELEKIIDELSVKIPEEFSESGITKETIPTLTGDEINALVSAKFFEELKGTPNFNAHDADLKASEFLRNLGITGNTYVKDQFGVGEGIRNYVVFDDKTPKIINRFARKKEPAVDPNGPPPTDKKQFEAWLKAKTAAGNQSNKKPTTKPKVAPKPVSKRTDNIQLDKVTDNTKIVDFLDQVAENYKPGKESFDDIQDAADFIEMTPAQAAKAKVNYTPAQTLAFKRVMIESAKQLEDLANQMAQGGSEKVQAQFMKAMTTHATIQEKYMGIATQAGRLLNSLKIIADDLDNVDPVALGNMLKEQGNAIFGDRAQVIRLAQLIQQHAANGNLKGVSKLTQATFKPRAEDYIFSAWYNIGLLSALATHTANMAGTGLNFISDLIDHGLASVMGQTRRWSPTADRVMGREVAARLWGTLVALKQFGTYKSMLNSFKTGTVGGQSTTKFNAPNLVMPGQSSYVLEAPTRVLAAEDEFFRQVIQTSNIYGLAVREAGKKNLKGKAFWAEVDKLIKNPTKGMIDKTTDYTKVIQFMDEPSFVGKTLNDLVHKVPKNAGPAERIVRGALRFAMPFVRTPDAIIRTVIRRSGPLGALDRYNIQGMKGSKAEQDIVKSRILIGSAMAAFVAIQAANGNITGEGPQDYRKKQEWLATHQPNSIRIGDKWYSIQGLEPIATNVLTVADAVGKYKNNNAEVENKEFSDLAAEFSLQYGRSILDYAYVDNFFNFMGIFDKGSTAESKLENYLAGVGSSIVNPAIIRQANQNYVDNAERDTRGDKSAVDRIAGRAMVGTPGFSDNLPQKYDVYGRPVTRGETFGPDMFSRVKTKDAESNDPVITELERLGSKMKTPLIGPPKEEVQGYGKLNATDFQDYQKLSGQMIVEEMRAIMQTDEWQRQMSDAEKIALTKKTVKKMRQTAREFLFPEEDAEPLE